MTGVSSFAWFTDPVFQQQVGARMPFAQANISVSVWALRGIPRPGAAGSGQVRDLHPRGRFRRSR